MADLYQRVASLEERAQAHDGGIGELRKDIADLRADLRVQIAAVRTDMVHRTEFMDFRREMNERFLAMDQKFTWLVGIQVAGLVAVIGALVGSYYR